MSLRCSILGHRWLRPTSLEHCCRCQARRSPYDGGNPRRILTGGTAMKRDWTNWFPLSLLVLLMLAAALAVVAVGNGSEEKPEPSLAERMAALKPLPDAVQYYYRETGGKQRQSTADEALYAQTLPKGRWIKETCTLAADKPEAVITGTELIAHCRYTVVTRDEAVSFVTTRDAGPAA